MGKDRVGKGVIVKHLGENTSSCDIVSSNVASLLHRNNSSFFVLEEPSQSSIQNSTQSGGSRSPKERNASWEIFSNSGVYWQMDWSSSTPDNVMYKEKRHFCDSSIINESKRSSSKSELRSDTKVDGMYDKNQTPFVDNVFNKSESNVTGIEGNNMVIYESQRSSGDISYRGMQISDMLESHTLEGSYSGVSVRHNNNDLEILSRRSAATMKRSPRRSPSPYSCSSASSFREPGNISSQQFQLDWGKCDNKNLISVGISETNNSIVGTEFSDQIDPRNGLFPNDHGRPGEELWCEDANFSGQSFTGKPHERNQYHPRIPVIEDNEIIPSNLFNGVSKLDKAEDVKEDVDESKTVQMCKNDNLVRVSHFIFVDNKYKRSVEIRTVTELMNIYKSLKGPIILPFVRQRGYYDQWARFPCSDATTRSVYPRSNTNVSIKCWTLFQAIQNDQINQAKSTHAPASTSSTNNKLVVPNPADVTCKSLDSIIEHYNQLSSIQNPVFCSNAKAAPATPLKTMISKASFFQSSSSRSSSGNSNDRQIRGTSSSYSQTKDNRNAPHTPTEKCSPVPLRKKSNSNLTKRKNNNQTNYVSQRKTGENDYENSEAQDGDGTRDATVRRERVNGDKKRSNKTNNSSEEAPIPTAELYPSSDDINSFTLQYQDNVLWDENQQIRTSQNNNYFFSDDQGSNIGDKKEREPSFQGGDGGEIDKKEISSNPKCQGKRNMTSSPRDFSRDPYDVNTSTVKLNLPFEVALSKTDCNEITNSFIPGEKRGYHQQNMANSNSGMVGLARRSKTKLKLTSPKSDRRDISLMTSPLHHPHHLKQSFLINELQCSKDIEGKYYQKLDNLSKKTGRSRSSPSWKSSSMKPPELPTRGYSMCERLETTENTQGGKVALNPDAFRPKSGRQSVISLANVHFLDLTDLKTMLRKTNTPIPRL